MVLTPATRVFATIFAAAVATSELVTWRVSRRPPTAHPGKSCAVIVLGYPTCRSGRLHPVQRWRTEIGVRTFADVDDGLLIFSGGATRGADESEAAVMARHAVSVLGVPGDRVRVETRARSTWDNIRFSLPLTESADQIAVASDPLHADKALRYLSHQRPDMMPRVVRAADFQVLERWWLKIPMLVNYVWLRASGRFGVPPDAP